MEEKRRLNVQAIINVRDQTKAKHRDSDFVVCAFHSGRLTGLVLIGL